MGFLTNAQGTDKNAILYKTIKIGTQTWMAENARTTIFQNGDPIPEAENVDEWVKAAEAGQPMYISWSKSSDIEEYGHLYNWYAITDKRGFAPKDWHIPSDKDWSVLAQALGGVNQATAKLKSKDDDFIDWENGGTNESGFFGLPAGKVINEGFYEDKGFFAYFWSSSEQEGFGQSRNLSYDNSPFDSALGHKGNGFSVRCVKD